jgi:pimeloyl-ACP methyl ester carboxylesterase
VEVRANGVALYYEEHGAGEPIVGLHGAGSSAAFWVDAAQELAKRGRTIVYDRRGHSRSERPEPYATDVHEQADDAAALIDALAAAPAVVIGRSYGGAVALNLALRHPDRVRALVLLEGDAPSLSEEAARWISELTQRIVDLAEDDIDSVAETVIRAVAGDETWGGMPEAAKEILTANGPALVAEVRAGFPEVTAEELATVAQPTLLVVGKESLQPGFDEVTSRMVEAMPSARVEWVEGGHLIDPAHPAVLHFVDDMLAAA